MFSKDIIKHYQFECKITVKEIQISVINSLNHILCIFHLMKMLWSSERRLGELQPCQQFPNQRQPQWNPSLHCPPSTPHLILNENTTKVINSSKQQWNFNLYSSIWLHRHCTCIEIFSHYICTISTRITGAEHAKGEAQILQLLKSYI